MLRGIGGSLGTAVFGTVFSTRLAGELSRSSQGPLGHLAGHGTRLTGAQVARLPASARAVYQHAYVHSLRPVFVMAAGVAALGFLFSLFLQERTLREAPATNTGLDDSLAAPRSPDSLAEIERSLTRVTTLAERTRFRERVAARAGIELSPGATWALVRIEEHGFPAARALAEADGVPAERIAEVARELSRRGLMEGEEGSRTLTPHGAEHAQRLLEARRELLREALADDSAQRDPEVTALLHRLARELCGEPPLEPAAPAPAATAAA
jgi:DNA-binding MarR family transcriptional regulator